MPRWKEPSSEYRFLTIPVLQKGKNLDFNSIELALESLELPISTAFINAWTAPETNLSNADLFSKDLSIIGDAFSELIKKAQPNLSVSYKESQFDVVTDIDQGIEMLFRIWIKRHFPEHKIIGEEGYKDQITSSDYVWFVDPIDGTANFVKGKDKVTFQVGCMYKGNHFASYMGLPFVNQTYVSPAGTPIVPPRHTDDIKIGTEHLPNKHDQEQILQSLCASLPATTVQVKSIGVNILELLYGRTTLFYKANVKLWDVMAPAMILEHYNPGFWDCVIYTPSQAYDLFSNDQAYTEYLNERHQKNCRIGLIVITPKNRADLKEKILSHYHELYPYTRPS